MITLHKTDKYELSVSGEGFHLKVRTSMIERQQISGSLTMSDEEAHDLVWALLDGLSVHAGAGKLPRTMPLLGVPGPTANDQLQVLIRRVTVVAVNLFARDCHRWSTRPCETCRTITDIMGEPFGCYWFAKLPKEQGYGATEAQIRLITYPGTWQGKARSGSSRPGGVRHGTAGGVRRGSEWCGKPWRGQGRAWQARQSRRVRDRCGTA